MKKVLLILCAVAMLSFESNDTLINQAEDIRDCPSYSTEVTWDCGSTCLTIKRSLSGYLEIDASLFENPYRKPTQFEILDFANDQNDLCD